MMLVVCLWTFFARRCRSKCTRLCPSTHPAPPRPPRQEKSKGRVLGGDGLVFFVHEGDSKVRVMRDRRTRGDLLAAFSDVDAAIVEEVWARTRLFAAASTILTSLRNSGHVELAHHLNINLQLDDAAVWPTLEEVFGAASGLGPGPGPDSASAAHPLASSTGSSGGWEHVALPDGGDNWVLIEEAVEDLAALGLGGGQDEAAAERGAVVAAEEAPTGAGRMNYRAALVSNLMDGDEGTAAQPPAAGRLYPLRRKRAKVGVDAAAAAKAAAEDEEDEEGGGGGGGGGFQEEYSLSKAVAARTRQHLGRKRLTESGKARMAEKAAKRVAARQAPRGAGSGGDDEAEAMEW